MAVRYSASQLWRNLPLEEEVRELQQTYLMGVLEV